VISIVSLNQVMAFIQDDPELQQHLPAVQAYRAEYGI
jgi:orotate phosphoribosyltransferase